MHMGNRRRRAVVGMQWGPHAHRMLWSHPYNLPSASLGLTTDAMAECCSVY